MEYTKPFLTFEQQADLLMKDRGMAADRDVLVRHLQDVGYYRLSGYWHIHKKRGSNEFWEGTTFEGAHGLRGRLARVPALEAAPACILPVTGRPSCGTIRGEHYTLRM